MVMGMSYIKINKYDILYILLIVIFSISLIIVAFITNDENINRAVVKYKGKEIMTIDMNKDQQIVLRKKDYPLLLDDITLDIKSKKIAVIKEKSPYHYCSEMGYVYEKNTPIICQPNHIIILLENDRSTDVDMEVR